MVHFPGFARARLWIHRAVRGFYPRGFPHSEIPGSKPACGSPGLIAACHVLHRLLLPRHPPCALSSLTIKLTRHTAVSLPSITPSLSSRAKHHFAKRKDAKSRDLELAFDFSLTTTRRENFMSLKLPAHRAFDALTPRAPAGVSLIGTHKNLQPCRLPNLFSYQTSSSLKLSFQLPA